MKAISFVGLGKYLPVTYVWDEGECPPSQCQTNLFPEAVARIFHPDKVLLMVTYSARRNEEVKGKLTDLSAKLGDVLETIDIPDGRSTAELWQIFDTCTQSIGEGERVILDVTHAFRSIPLIVFTVGAFLRRTKGVAIEKILYGAFDAREPFREQPLPTDRVPIFDLTPLLDLLDWSSGVEAFLQRGDGSLLAVRLAQTRKILAHTYREDHLPTKLKSVADSLGKLSDALYLSRPRDAMGVARELLRKIDAARDEIARWAKPFAVILERTKKEIEPLAHSTPDVLDSENLRRQLALIELYVAKGLIVQAITLAREWMVSWVCLRTGRAAEWLEAPCRKVVEDELGKAALSLRSSHCDLPNTSIAREVAEIWNELVQYRNALAHCGMRQGESSPEKLRAVAIEVIGRMRGLLEESAR